MPNRAQLKRVRRMREIAKSVNTSQEHGVAGNHSASALPRLIGGLPSIPSIVIDKAEMPHADSAQTQRVHQNGISPYVNYNNIGAAQPRGQRELPSMSNKLMILAQVALETSQVVDQNEKLADFNFNAYENKSKPIIIHSTSQGHRPGQPSTSNENGRITHETCVTVHSRLNPANSPPGPSFIRVLSEGDSKGKKLMFGNRNKSVPSDGLLNYATLCYDRSNDLLEGSHRFNAPALDPTQQEFHSPFEVLANANDSVESVTAYTMHIPSSLNGGQTVPCQQPIENISDQPSTIQSIPHAGTALCGHRVPHISGLNTANKQTQTHGDSPEQLVSVLSAIALNADSATVTGQTLSQNSSIQRTPVLSVLGAVASSNKETATNEHEPQSAPDAHPSEIAEETTPPETYSPGHESGDTRVQPDTYSNTFGTVPLDQVPTAKLSDAPEDKSEHDPLEHKSDRSDGLGLIKPLKCLGCFPCCCCIISQVKYRFNQLKKRCRVIREDVNDGIEAQVFQFELRRFNFRQAQRQGRPL